jgi:2-hydroxyacyl-CoA lyase 1
MNGFGASQIAKTLKELGVTTVFGIVGFPVAEIAEFCIINGINFIGFRNEQAASYAATAYGYLTGRPGVCLVVPAPGVLHALAGVGNAHANAWPLLLLAGSNETYFDKKGAFQECDHIAALAPWAKVASKPGSIELIPGLIRDAYRAAFFGRPGTAFVDFPADFIRGDQEFKETPEVPTVPDPRMPAAEEEQLLRVAKVLREARAPLVLIGKGAAYARAEGSIRALINSTNMPFLPSPMGKGVVPDSHHCNASSARSAAMKYADVVLVLGARLNWIFSFGEHPKWNREARFIQIDIDADELGKNAADAELGIVGDVKIVVPQLLRHLQGWKWDPQWESSFGRQLRAARKRNEEKAVRLAAVDKVPLTYERAFEVIKNTLHSLSPPGEGGICYISEGSNTMDISRSIFPLEHPRLKLDAGSWGTMGIGMGYCIAAHEAYNGVNAARAKSGPAKRKKIIALEGDSGFGFSAMEIETMARHKMDVLIFVINNGGIFTGDSEDGEEWRKRQENTIKGEYGFESLRSSTLGWEVRYEKMAEMVGGKGFFVRNSEELARATEEGFKARVPVVVNVIIESVWKGKIVSPLRLADTEPKMLTFCAGLQVGGQ